jgi:hypothetical protein
MDHAHNAGRWLCGCDGLTHLPLRIVSAVGLLTFMSPSSRRLRAVARLGLTALTFDAGAYRAKDELQDDSEEHEIEEHLKRHYKPDGVAPRDDVAESHRRQNRDREIEAVRKS